MTFNARSSCGAPLLITTADIVERKRQLSSVVARRHCAQRPALRGLEPLALLSDDGIVSALCTDGDEQDAILARHTQNVDRVAAAGAEIPRGHHTPPFALASSFVAAPAISLDFCVWA
jgi:hypothetical protein